jgi:hypothetical protein
MIDGFARFIKVNLVKLHITPLFSSTWNWSLDRNRFDRESHNAQWNANKRPQPVFFSFVCLFVWFLVAQALCSFKKYKPPPLPYFKVNICPFPLPHFASIFFAYLWSFRWPNYIVTLSRYFSFRLPHLNIPTGPWFYLNNTDKIILECFSDSFSFPVTN